MINYFVRYRTTPTSGDSEGREGEFYAVLTDSDMDNGGDAVSTLGEFITQVKIDLNLTDDEIDILRYNSV